MAASFSVVIPVYKGEAYLAETIESVLAQKLIPVEILVIDDGSPDDSYRVAQSFGERVTVIRRENAGVSAARNYGASIATGSWLAFLDADDIWEPDYLAANARAIEQSPGADLCYSGRRNLVYRTTKGAFVCGDPVDVPTGDELRNALLERAPFMPSTVTIRRSAYAALGGCDGRFNSVEDWDLWLRFLHAGAVFTTIPKPLVRYRVHSASLTNNVLPVLAKSLSVVRERVLPHLSVFERVTRGRRVISRLEGEAAILLRENRQTGALPLMLRSVGTHPFHQPRRYKIALQMLLRALMSRAA